VTAHRRLLLATAIALGACNTRDGETDEAAIAADSAAASAEITAPSDSGRAADGGARLQTPPRPLDVNPSIPREPGPGSGS